MISNVWGGIFFNLIPVEQSSLFDPCVDFENNASYPVFGFRFFEHAFRRPSLASDNARIRVSGGDIAVGSGQGQTRVRSVVRARPRHPGASKYFVVEARG